MTEPSLTRRAAERGQRVYDRWARYSPLYRLVDQLSRPIRREAVEVLDLDRGATVLDLGCGPGGSLDLLTDAVGPDGRVVGCDYSAGMAALAGDRSPGASVCRADARTLPFPRDSVDGVFASLALSAIADAPTAIAEARRVLRPGGRLAVVDGRLPGGVTERVLAPMYERLVNWQGVDVLDCLRDAFPTVDVVSTFDAGLGFIAVAYES